MTANLLISPTKLTVSPLKIGIAGAGLLGRLVAMRLLQSRHKVSLFDRDNGGGEQSCGLVAAGMLSPFAEIDTEAEILRLGKISLRLWPQYLATLSPAVDFKLRGSLLVAHHQDSQELDYFKTRLTHRYQQPLNLELCDRARLSQLEPELSLGFNQGLFFAEEGSIDNQQLFAALTALFKQSNLVWKINTPVTAVTAHTITTAVATYTFDYVFDCRGLGAKLTCLRGVRGELVIVHAPEVNFSRPIRLLHPRYPLYVVPRRDHHYVIGASSIESDDHSPISVRSLLELLSAAYSLHSGFAEARLVSTGVQCRPVFSDHLPQIVHEPGLIRINGLYRHGFLLAPALVEQSLTLLQ